MAIRSSKYVPKQPRPPYQPPVPEVPEKPTIWLEDVILNKYFVTADGAVAAAYPQLENRPPCLGRVMLCFMELKDHVIVGVHRYRPEDEFRLHYAQSMAQLDAERQAYDLLTYLHSRPPQLPEIETPNPQPPMQNDGDAT